MRLLRAGVLVLGFGVLGVLGAVEFALSRRDGPSPRSSAATPEDSDADWVTAASVPPPSKAVTRMRLLLGALGVLVAVYGAYVLVGVLPLVGYFGLALWLLGAIVLHDAVLVPAITVLRATAHRAGRRLPVTAIRLTEAAFVLVGTLTLLAVPEIYAQHLGSNNPTVLPGSYGRALLAVWLVVAVLTGLAVATVALRARRSDPRPATADPPRSPHLSRS